MSAENQCHCQELHLTLEIHTQFFSHSKIFPFFFHARIQPLQSYLQKILFILVIFFKLK